MELNEQVTSLRFILLGNVWWVLIDDLRFKQSIPPGLLGYNKMAEKNQSSKSLPFTHDADHWGGMGTIVAGSEWSRVRAMEPNCNNLTERILRLTLEIIYLLTGEDDIVAKKTSVDGQNPIMVPLHFLLTEESSNDKKILEVTKKIIELLMGEVSHPSYPALEGLKVNNIKAEDANAVEKGCVEGNWPSKEEEVHPENNTDGSSKRNPPERCPPPQYSRDSTQEHHEIPHHDQSGNWSNCNISIKKEIKVEEEEDGMMQEWKYSEGDRDLYKDVMMEDQPPLTSPDGSSKRNPPERCPRPLYSGDSTQEHHTLPHHDQEGDMKTEVKAEEETHVRGDQLLIKEAEMMVTITKEESSLDISIGGHSGWNTSKGHLILPPDYNEDDNGMAQYSPEVNPGTQYIHHRLDDMESSADSFIYNESNDKSHTVIPDVQQSCYSTEGSPDSSNPEQYSFISLDTVNPRSHNAEFPFSCSQCGKGFKKRKVFRIHLMGHAGKKIYSCPECENLYLTNCGLIAHKRLHAGEKNFKCSECGESFGLKSQLTAHQREHSEPFSCSECEKTFKKRQQLTRHQRTHTGEKPYSCSECGKAFTLRMHLTRHYLVHTGVKPFPCPECWKSFSTKANRDNHLRVHTGERPYTCSQCRKCFARRETLVIHQRKHCKTSRGISKS